MPQETITFYTNPMSRGCIVRWMLEEIGEPYETKLMDFKTTIKSSEFLAINPMGKVPALTHGKALVTETVAICAYLADAFPKAGLAPTMDDHEARAAYYRWLFFGAGPFEGAVVDKVLGITISEEQQSFVGYGNYDLTMNVLEKELSKKDFLSGDKFTTADLYIAAALDFGLKFGTVPANPTFEKYVALHKSRPAAIRAEKIDSAPVPKE